MRIRAQSISHVDMRGRGIFAFWVWAGGEYLFYY